ncbi:MAG: hypothetical protein HKL80_03290 [Acidimicrobiales bacterium]|nr:hypothetical protein [Acidimicrobiales bacterium]
MTRNEFFASGGELYVCRPEDPDADWDYEIFLGHLVSHQLAVQFSDCSDFLKTVPGIREVDHDDFEIITVVGSIDQHELEELVTTYFFELLSQVPLSALQM